MKRTEKNGSVTLFKKQIICKKAQSKVHRGRLLNSCLVCKEF